MFIRRLRGLLRIRHQAGLLKCSTRDHVEPNLKISAIAPERASSFCHLQGSCFTTCSVRPSSNLPEASNHKASSETSDNEEEGSDSDENTLYDARGRPLRVTENGYVYNNILRKSDKYKNTIIPVIEPDEPIPDEVVERILQKNWKDFAVSEILEDFRILSYHARLNELMPEEKHAKIFEALTTILKDLLNDQLWMLLRWVEMWYPMPWIKLEPFEKFEQAIDNECWKRGRDWNADELLMTCDMLFHLRRARQSGFVKYAIKKLGMKPYKMSPANYVHYMFLLNLCRKPAINMYELEYRLQSLMATNEFTAEELGIVSMAFFKTATRIRNPDIVQHIIQKCIDNMDSLKDILISAVMKMARFSIGMNNTETLHLLLQRFYSKVGTSSVMCLVHAAHSGATTLVYEKKTISAIVDRSAKEIPTARLKDIERLLFSMMIFNYPKDSPTYQTALEQLRNPVRTSELKKYPRTYACSLMYLSHANIYPLDIIEKLLAPEYLRDVYQNNAFRIGREYLAVECGLKIEVPEYKGPFLADKIYAYIAKRYACPCVWEHDPSVRVQTYQKFMSEVIHNLKAVVGEKNYTVDQLLPHHRRADIILCMDSDNNFIEPEPMLAACEKFSIKYPPKVSEDYKWFVITLATHNDIFRGTVELTGNFNAKARQLRKIGYTTIPILLPLWKTFVITERLKYLRSVLNQYIPNNKEKITS